ncbi:MAG: hypothetical protein Q4D89_00030 [Arachnia propionica]|uniref:hypothetical protein n=1 Tax=Arachnia propionica TaxID=1750 RepID=UPI002693886A|nr:hypothetical protein [Arachnia propionica]
MLPALLVSDAASLFGNAAIAVVLPWLVLERTEDPALAGCIVFALLFTPSGAFWLMATAMVLVGIGSGVLHPVANVMMTTSVPEDWARVRGCWPSAGCSPASTSSWRRGCGDIWDTPPRKPLTMRQR